MDRNREEGHMAQDTDVALPPDNAGVRGARFRLPARRTWALRTDEVAADGGGASRLPDGPTHQIGIGALVIHPVSGKMLAVRERSGPAARAKLWKMPTGLTDPGEDIAAAAVRELKEETGLDCVFDRM